MVVIGFPLVFLFGSELQDSSFFLGDKKKKKSMGSVFL